MFKIVVEVVHNHAGSVAALRCTGVLMHKVLSDSWLPELDFFNGVFAFLDSFSWSHLADNIICLAV